MCVCVCVCACYFSGPYNRYSQFSTNSSRAMAFVETISGEHPPSPPTSVSISLDLMRENEISKSVYIR